MINIENYEFFVDKRQSSKGKEYYGLYIKFGNIEQLVCFINKNVYDNIFSLSK